MLKGISPLLSPELLKVLAEMGHGDEIVFGDANFPASNCAKRLVRYDGHSVSGLLSAILPLFPIDCNAGQHAIVMRTEDGIAPPVWSDYMKIILSFEPTVQLSQLPRQEFYDRAKEAYAIVATGERALYGNLILCKGVCK